ncbi:Streptomyces sporulation and cell division protein, SsgA [Amycolatopsis pretoriensis]|uniref:Streptomyces sporulation and cell division protein, SsgA n=1 Tax=Amycolatopsis pretoriensis TaxID=218821 RepID=A0A1H5QIN3_9PSEU|nr:SsgA family sporulation/cell division regulator [Amycolatopsis pretoriensis]SEF25926.1 Streptomyces sporulation and cell division protein, SsgA [Amycolatopsis pretoriensis]
MADPHNVTSASIDFALRTFGAGPRPVPAELEYDTRDPYAVAVVLHAGPSAVRWLFGRDLLADGLLARCGDGDVRVGPAGDPALVVVELTSPDGAAVLEAPAKEIAAFLDRTYDVVPAGSESDWFDFDQELEKLSYQD